MLGRLLREIQYQWYYWRHLRDDFSEEPHFFIDSAYIGISREYRKNYRQKWSFNERNSLADMRELSYAHALLVGVIAGMLEENNGKYVPIENEEISRKFVLTAAFVQGIFLCEQSILRGMYLQAGALIRQEYEVLALLTEIREDKRKDGKQANAKYAPWKGSCFYGELSAFAHMSDHRILDTFIGYNTSWGDFASTVPQYQKTNGTKLYARHTAYVFGLVEELRSLYGEMYNYKSDKRETDVQDNAFSILVKHGVFKVPK